jgi:hypothetical protein
MQPLARDGLTAAQVTALLRHPALRVSAGCDLLDVKLNVTGDLTPDLVGGQISRSLYADVHGTCSLTISRTLVWGVQLVRPYMVLAADSRTARINLGVYSLTTPELEVGPTPPTYQVSGFDRLYLLGRQVGADYTAAAGVTYRQALLDVFTAAGLPGALVEGVAADDVLPKARTWPLVADRVADPDQTDTPVTYLRIVNDLLRAINFRAVWADPDGLFRCQAYVEPAARPPEFVWDADDLTAGMVGEDRTVSEDVWKTPNRWVFRQTNRPAGAPTPTVGDGLYVRTLPDAHPQSAVSRGLVWNSVVDYEAATQAKLVELGDRRVASDQRTTVTYDVSTAPFPVAGHADVFTYTDVAAGASGRKVQATGWTFDLAGSDVQWEWEAV